MSLVETSFCSSHFVWFCVIRCFCMFVAGTDGLVQLDLCSGPHLWGDLADSQWHHWRQRCISHQRPSAARHRRRLWLPETVQLSCSSTTHTHTQSEWNTNTTCVTGKYWQVKVSDFFKLLLRVNWGGSTKNKAIIKRLSAIYHELFDAKWSIILNWMFQVTFTRVLERFGVKLQKKSKGQMFYKLWHFRP